MFALLAKDVPELQYIASCDPHNLIKSLLVKALIGRLYGKSRPFSSSSPPMYSFLGHMILCLF